MLYFALLYKARFNTTKIQNKYRKMQLHVFTMNHAFKMPKKMTQKRYTHYKHSTFVLAVGILKSARGSLRIK
jgi:hypothetical protein